MDPLRLIHPTLVLLLLLTSATGNADIGAIDIDRFIQSARNQIGVTIVLKPG